MPPEGDSRPCRCPPCWHAPSSPALKASWASCQSSSAGGVAGGGGRGLGRCALRGRRAPPAGGRCVGTGSGPWDWPRPRCARARSAARGLCSKRPHPPLTVRLARPRAQLAFSTPACPNDWGGAVPRSARPTRGARRPSPESIDVWQTSPRPPAIAGTLPPGDAWPEMWCRPERWRRWPAAPWRRPLRCFFVPLRSRFCLTRRSRGTARGHGGPQQKNHRRPRRGFTGSSDSMGPGRPTARPAWARCGGPRGSAPAWVRISNFECIWYVWGLQIGRGGKMKKERGRVSVECM
jgi:hypothetical protein